MKKYLYFINATIKLKTAYLSRFIIGLMSAYMELIAIIYIWISVFKQSSNIGGYTTNEMIAYIVLSFSLLSILRINVSDAVGYDIETGDIVSYFIKPISYINRLIFISVGEMLFNFVYLFPPLIVILLYLNVISFSFLRFISFILSIILGAVIYFIIDFMVGLSAFFVNYIWGLLLMKNVIFRFVSGELFPLSFLPKSIANIFEFLPFNYLTYRPIMILFNKLDSKQILETIVIQIFWIILLSIIAKILWHSANKNLSINGG